MTSTTVSDAALQECANEPIHLLGRTQRFGVLLGFDDAGRVAVVSANAGAWCGRPARALLGERAESVLPRRSVDAAFAHARVAAACGAVQRLHRVAWPGRDEAVDVTVHASGGLVIVEAEPVGDEPPGATIAIEACTRELAGLPGVEELARSAATVVARVTGYDRVMVYRFAADGSGTVIAEHLAPGLESYLGLRYPAGDVPPQARRLYLRNPSRVIVDSSEEGSELLSRDAMPLDLSLAVLRSVSPVHLEYLRNMGTAASMSISLIVDGQLWGLIACHHGRPLRPPLACRAMGELLGRLYSVALARAERRPLGRDIRTLLAAPGVDPLLDAEAGPEHDAAAAALGRLMRVTGVLSHVDGRIGSWGSVPDPAQAADLLAALGGAGEAPVTVIESLEGLSEGLGRLLPGVAGMLALPLAGQGRDWLLLLRDEVLRHVSWAGNPHKSVLRGPDGRLSPRASFDSWRASVHGHCEPWTATEIELAKVLRVRLLEVLNARHEQRAIESTRRAAQQQALLVRELNHRVRNMLGLIKGLVQQTARNASSVDDLTQRLHDRVHAMSRAYTQIEKAQWQPTPLAALLQESTAAFGDSAQVSLAGGPVMLEPQAFLSFAMVIHELATNARKYGALSVPHGRVTVSWSVAEGGALQIDWRETGGPPVVPPARLGFGSRVIRQGLEHQLRGHATMDFEPQGLHCRLWTTRGFIVPAAAAAPPAAAAAAAAPRSAKGGRRQTRRSASRPAVPGVALVLEDDLVLALLAETMLHQMGCRRVLTAGSRDDALNLLHHEAVDIALLDVNLGDHSSEAVAIRLGELGVPAIVTTGYSDTDSVPEPLRALPRLSKPYTQHELAQAVAAATTAGAVQPIRASTRSTITPA